MTQSDPETLRLIVVTGPAKLDTIEIPKGKDKVLGRSSTCDVSLEDPDASISRKHIEVSNRDGKPAITDLGSRNGTQLNGTKLLPEFSTEVKRGDTIRLGSWVFRVMIGGDPPSHDSTLIHTLNDSDQSTGLVERVSAEPLANLASHRLAVLLECADQIHSSQDLEQAAESALHAMVESTGFSRAAYLAPSENKGDYETIAFKSRNPLDDVQSVNFSQSLLETAAEGDVVRLSGTGARADFGQSIAELDIHSALCVPVMVDESPVGFMYLDARGSESAVKHDASAFGRAVGRLLGLTIANLISKEREIEQHAMQYDLDAAANAQRLLLPPESGTVAGVSYAMLMKPGRLVAGDLFGVIELDDGRVCTFLGDVSGKGAGAAIMMATTQSYIHAMFEKTSDLAEVITNLNRHIADRSTGQFVTMWVAVIDPKSYEVEFIDAGHGHWLVTKDGQQPVRPEYSGGLVVGIDPDVTYSTERITLEPGQRMVIFSDGIVEQTTPDSQDEFGMERAGALLSQCTKHTEDVTRLLEGVLGYAQSDSLRDDTTIASIGVLSLT